MVVLGGLVTRRRLLLGSGRSSFAAAAFLGLFFLLLDHQHEVVAERATFFLRLLLQPFAQLSRQADTDCCVVCHLNYSYEISVPQVA
jgi:hypothetical protein